MKKKQRLLLVIAIAILITLLPIIANANTSGDSAELDVSFTIDESMVETTPDSLTNQSTPSGTYTIIIPAAINLKEQMEIVILSEDISIPAGTHVAVYIDGAQTFSDDGKFYLNHNNTQIDQMITCDILRWWGDTEMGPREYITGQTDHLVATFKNGDVVPSTYGRLVFQPGYHTYNAVGIYTGTVYFKIGIESD